MPSSEDVFVGSLGSLNTLRVLTSSRLRSADRIFYRHAGLLARCLFGDRLCPIPDQDYSAMHGRTHCHLRAEVITDLTSRSFQDEPNRYRRRFLQHQMGWALYDAIGLIQDSELLSGGRSTFVLVPWSPFLATIRKHYGRDRSRIVPCFKKGMLSRGVRLLGGHVWGMLRALGRAAVRREAVGEGDEPTLCVRCFRGGPESGLRHDFFWLKSPKPEHRIILEHVGSAYVLTDGFLAWLKARGIRVIENHARRRRVAGSERWHPSLRFFCRKTNAGISILLNAGTALFQGSGIEAWRAWHGFRFDMLASERAEFYRRFNVKAELITGFMLDEPAHTYAMRLAGGSTCMAQYTTAFDPFDQHTSVSTFHLYFGTQAEGWGRPVKADVNILNGYLYKGAAGTDERVEEIRARLRAHGAQRSVCFLDEGFAREPHASCMLRFYAYLVNRVVDDSRFGVVVKPKKNSSVDVLVTALGDRYRRAVETGRFIVLDWSYYPGVAARSTNLTVGVVATAALESAVEGCPTLYLNTFGYLPAFMRPIKENVHDTVDGVIRAMERHFQEGNASCVGRHPEEFLRTVDHCRDREAPDRIETLLMKYLRCVRAGKTRDAAIAETLEDLRSRWNVAIIPNQESGSAQNRTDEIILQHSCPN